jgi:ribonuclease P protein component
MRSGGFLTKPQQYAAVYGQARSWASGSLVLKAIPNNLDISRYGLSVSRRVGKAVTRNLVKRRLREILRQAGLNPGRDLVFVVRPSAAQASYASLDKSARFLLMKAGIMDRPGEEGPDSHTRDIPAPS